MVIVMIEETDAFTTRFGENLRALRVSNGLTQDQLAMAIGLSRASVANIESGRQQVSLRHAFAMARALAPVSIDDLVK